MGIEVKASPAEQTGIKVSKEINLKNLLSENEEIVSFESILGSIDLEKLLSLSEDIELPLNEISLEDIKALNLDDLVVEDIIKLVSVLNGKDSLLKSDFIDKKFKQLANNEIALNEFKEAKSVKEIISLADKYGLKLKSIDITEKKVTNFDNILNIIQDKKEAIPKDKLNSLLKSETTLKTLSILDAPILKKETQSKIANKTESLLKDFLGYIEKDKSSLNDKSKIDTAMKMKDTQVINEKETKIDIIQENNITKDKEIKQTVKPEVIAVTKKITTEDEKNTNSKNNIAKSDRKETTKTNISQATTINTAKTNTQNIVSQVVEVLPMEDDTGFSDTKEVEHTDNKTSLKDIKTQQNSMNKVQIKETLSKFSTTLEDQVKEYKAPLMKVKLTLNPHNLGEVDVTITTRGNNININLSSNTQTMAIFTQNQAEFKNAIADLGFSEFSMNFQEKEESKQEQKQEQNDSDDFENEEELDQETTSIDILTPNYV